MGMGCCGVQNVGMMERFIRLVVGLALLVLPLYWASSWAIVGLLGVFPVASALLGFCPVYKMMGCSACGKSPCECKDGGCCGPGEKSDMKDAKNGGGCCRV